MQALIEQTLSDVLQTLGVPFSAINRETVAGQAVYAIATEESARLIGSHGDAVHALDHIVKKILEQKRGSSDDVSSEGDSETPLFLIDVNGYRSQKIKDLEAKALVMAERARSFQYDVELSPMSAYERLIVHTVLADTPNVKTESEGEGRGRRVVIRFVA